MKCSECIAVAVAAGQPTPEECAGIYPVIYTRGTCGVCGEEKYVTKYPDCPEFNAMKVKGMRSWDTQPLSPEGEEPIEDRSRPEYVLATIEDDGLRYAMETYSDYPEVEDHEFHQLREAYLASLKAADDLERYVRNAVTLNVTKARVRENANA